MKQLLNLFIICLYGCTSSDISNNIVPIDVRESNSTIQLNLKDIADVEYIKLGNDSDFLVKSRPLVFSDNYILTKGGESGEILFLIERENLSTNSLIMVTDLMNIII